MVVGSSFESSGWNIYFVHQIAIAGAGCRCCEHCELAVL